MTVLSAKNLRKEYHGNPVVESVSLQVETGQIVGLLGPNGAGKTTSFYMIVGLVEATDGHVFIDDREITSLPIHERAKAGIGYLPQEPSRIQEAHRIRQPDGHRAAQRVRQQEGQD